MSALGAAPAGDDSDDDGEPRLAIVDGEGAAGDWGAPRAGSPSVRSPSMEEDAVSASEAIESLLLLGRGPVMLGGPSATRPPALERSRSLCEGLGSPSRRRYSSGCEPMDFTNSHDSGDDKARGNNSSSYYQRMRERNNEASKRCRLRRRLKAQSMENQSNLLAMSNRLLKQRIVRMEKIGTIFKEGVRRIQSQNCNCLDTVAAVKKVNVESADVASLSNASLLKNSRGYREQKVDPSVQGTGAATSSEDESASSLFQGQGSERHMELSTNAPVKSFPSRTELTITPVASAVVAVNAMPTVVKVETPDPLALEADQSIPITVVQQLKKQQDEERKQIAEATNRSVANTAKTALDVLNDTIINSLKTPVTTAGSSSLPSLIVSPSPPTPLSLNSAPAPLNLVKLVPAAALTRQSQPPSPLILPRTPSFTISSPTPGQFPTTPPPKQLILLSSPSSRKLSTSSVEGEVVVKCEPEIQIVECDPPPSVTTPVACPPSSTSPGVDPTASCIAVSRGCSASGCRGELLNLNKLNTYLDLLTKRTTRDSGSAAMERAIIKSRLKIPFWKADESVSFICESHRQEIVNSAPMTHCSLCNKKRAKKQTSSPQSLMMTITYRMSLENYTTTGNILPIGLLVCGNCKDKHLKGVDFSNSQIFQPDSTTNFDKTAENKGTTSNGISITPIASSTTMTTAKRNGIVIERADIKRRRQSPVTIQPVPSEVSPAAYENIFARIGRLNDALRAINPQYRPIGFSITSIESCSQSVLQDAVAATETAVSTLMSVIAPGQEAFLWNAIRPKLDAKLGDRESDLPKDPSSGPSSSSSRI